MKIRIPLYLRIWLAVVLAVTVITVAFGWLLRAEQEQRPVREFIVRNEAGEVLGQSRGRPTRVPGQGAELEIEMRDGSTLVMQIPPRPRRPGEAPPPILRPWMRGSSGLLWMLGIVAVAVAVGSYPIVRRLTQRLDALRAGVERWGQGDLSARVDESGSDEAAQLARRFNQAAQRLELMIASHKSLLANASHELRSPLARIRMGIELMAAPASDPARAEIERNIAELNQLIDEILLASRLDARAAEIGPFEPVDLTGLAAEECARADAELLAVREGSAAVVADGAPKLLRRVMRNLLENARRYSEGPVNVEVLTEPAGALVGTHALLRVSDHGPGVPAELRERIFEPFYRLPGASERAGGVGLGLALVRAIVQRHGGSVVCEGREGGGARFSVRLPLRAALAARV